MICPRCKSNNCKEHNRSKDDNIDNLDHSHMICNICGAHFNHWHTDEETLKKLFGENQDLYIKKSIFEP